MSHVLELTGVHFTFQNKHILEEITTSFEKGTTTVIMGPSGCGKSTLLKVAAGLTVHQEGTVAYLGQNIDKLNEAETIEMRRHMSFVFQDGALWANKTIYQNLELPMTFHFPNFPPDQIKNKIRHWTRFLGIDDELGHRPSELSIGEQQLASLCRALVTEPEVILLDEPTSTLDGQSRTRVIEILTTLKKEGKTLVIVTQLPEIAARLADRLVLLKGGKILTQGEFSEVVRNPDPQVIEILTSVLSQASTFSSDILDLLGG